MSARVFYFKVDFSFVLWSKEESELCDVAIINKKLAKQNLVILQKIFLAEYCRCRFRYQKYLVVWINLLSEAN